MRALSSDLRQALRRISGSPAYAAGVALAVALATAAAALIYALADAVVLRPLPFEDPDRLVWIWATRTDRDKAFFSIDDFLDHRAASRSLAQVAAFCPRGMHLARTGPPQRLRGVLVTGNGFSLLGVRAALGRTLVPRDEDPDAEPVVVLSHTLWRTSFGGDPAVIGSTIRLNDQAWRVVGVLGPDFLFPGATADVVLPLAPERDPRRGQRGTNFLTVYGRLAPGATRAQVREEWGRVARELRQRHPVENAKKTEPRVLTLAEEMVGGYRRSLLALVGAVLAVLLLASANVSALQLVRAATREHELVVRLALGASRGDLTRVLMLEAGLLVAAGGLLGLGLARALLSGVVALVPVSLPRVAEARIDTGVALVTLCGIALAAAISALLPALLGSRRLDLLAALRADARAQAGAARPRVRQGLAALQVAAAVVLLVTTGLVLETYRRLDAQGPGARVEGLIHARLSLPPRGPKTQAAVEAFVARVRESVRAVPGVRSVGVTNALPMSGLNNRSDFVIVGHEPRQASELPGGQLRWIGAGLAEALQLPLVRGRLFTEDDEQARTPVALVDEPLARRFWPGREPIGEGLRLEFGGPQGPVFQVVGVVGSVKHFDLAEAPLGTLYLPVHALQDPFRPFFAAGISVAAAGDVEDGATRRRFAAALAAVDPDVPVSPVTSMSETLDHAQATRGFTAAVLAVFAAVALLLAVSGLYAVVSAGVASQKRELGLRAALGAAPASVVGSALRPAVQALGFGLPAGLLLAAGVARALGAEIDAGASAPVWVIAPLCLALAGLVAAIVPARRALRLDLVRLLATG